MPLVKGKSPLGVFLRHALMGFGSALVLSLYSVVDAIMVGRYEGEAGMAAVATIVPVWTIALSLGLLFGIGGSVHIAKHLGADDETEANRYFSTSLIVLGAVSSIAYLTLLLFDKELLAFFGAEGEVLELALLYVRPIKWVLPAVIFSQALVSYVRNDFSPLLASIAVIAGGLTNILFDYLLVFTFNLGIYGAGIATAGSECLTCLILTIRLLFKRKKLAFAIPTRFFGKARDILFAGFPSFVIDLSIGIAALIMNRELVLRFEGESALAIYGVIGQIAFVTLSFSYGIAHASQPLVSQALGEKDRGKMGKYLLYGLVASAILGLLSLLLALLFPEGVTTLFLVDPSPELLAESRTYFAPYAASYFLMCLNVYLLYYLMSSGRKALPLLISLARSIALPLLVIPLIGEYLSPLLIFAAQPFIEGVSLLALTISFLLIHLAGRQKEKGTF